MWKASRTCLRLLLITCLKSIAGPFVIKPYEDNHPQIIHDVDFVSCWHAAWCHSSLTHGHEDAATGRKTGFTGPQEYRRVFLVSAHRTHLLLISYSVQRSRLGAHYPALHIFYRSISLRIYPLIHSMVLLFIERVHLLHCCQGFSGYFISPEVILSITHSCEAG